MRATPPRLCGCSTGTRSRGARGSRSSPWRRPSTASTTGASSRTRSGRTVSSTLRHAARPATGCFNGKLEAPRLEVAGRVVADWDFSRDMSGDAIRDASGNGHDGRLVNMPMRAVTGRRWTGDEVDWRRAPEQWGAVFFHDDDLEDAGWEPGFELVVPDTLPSGVYA